MELIPCPFCGSVDIEVAYHSQVGFWMQCACGAIGASGNTEEDAAEAWNRRYEPPNNPLTGDIYLNPVFGDLWVVEGTSFVKINDGYAIDIDEPEGFVKVGHICMEGE